MRIIFMGSPHPAAVSLERLLRTDHEIAAVVTQPDRRAGRGRKLTAPPVKEVALKGGLPVLQPEKLIGTDFHETLAEYQPDAYVVVAYGHILRENILGVPRLGSINAHYSLLPRYRGPAPVQWTIVNGESKTGVTVIKLDRGMDTGPVLAQSEEIDILEDDDALSIGDMLTVLGAELIVQVLDKGEADGAFEGVAQNDEEATLAPMLKKQDGHIDWTQRREQIHCRVRGLRPWPGAFFNLNDKSWRIGCIEYLRPDLAESLAPQDETKPGEIVGVVKGEGVIVRAADGPLLLARVTSPGKPERSAYDCVNGGMLKVGQILE